MSDERFQPNVEVLPEEVPHFGVYWKVVLNIGDVRLVSSRHWVSRDLADDEATAVREALK